MEIKTTDEEIAKFACICVSATLLKVGVDLDSTAIVDMKNSLMKDISANYHSTVSAFDMLVNGTFYTN